MLKEESLLKFVKSTELLITLIEDDSSGTEDPTKPGTVVKILHVAQPISASGSIPTRDGLVMKVKDNKVYCAADDWERFKKEATELEDGTGILYKGEMHLDVSKPKTRRGNDGEITVTSTSKIWLTGIKFSKRRGTLIQDGQTKLNSFMKDFFGKGDEKDLTVAAENTKPAGEQKEEQPKAKNEPKVVANKPA